MGRFICLGCVTLGAPDCRSAVEICAQFLITQNEFLILSILGSLFLSCDVVGNTFYKFPPVIRRYVLRNVLAKKIEHSATVGIGRDELFTFRSKRDGDSSQW